MRNPAVNARHAVKVPAGCIASSIASNTAKAVRKIWICLLDLCENIAGRTICALGDAAAWPVQGFLKHYRKEFEYHIEHKRCLV